MADHLARLVASDGYGAWLRTGCAQLENVGKDKGFSRWVRMPKFPQKAGFSRASRPGFSHLSARGPSSPDLDYDHEHDYELRAQTILTRIPSTPPPPRS